MADKVVSLEFNVKTAGAVIEINKVTQATEGATAASNQYEKQLNDIKKTTDGGGFKELTRALKEYQNLALQAGENSPIGRQALSEAGELKDRLMDLKSAIRTTGQDGRSLQASLQLGGGIVAGFGAVQGVMALVGSESEDLQKTLVKLQAVQATLASVEEIRSVLEKESALRITAVTIAEKARAAATAVSTFVTNGASLALKVFKAALVATGIGAFIVVLGGVIAYWDELTQAIGLATKSTADYTAKLDYLANKEQNRFNSKINLAKEELKIAELKGESDKELFERELKINDLELKARERQRVTDQELIDSYRKRRKEGQNFTDDEKQRFDKLIENEKNYYSEIGKIEFQERVLRNTFYKNEREKEDEARKLRQEKEKEDLKLWRQQRQERDNQIAEEISNIDKQFEEEKQLKDKQLKEDQDRASEAAAQFAADLKAQNDAKISEEIRVRDAKVQIANDLQSTLTSLGNLIINDSAKAVKFNKAMALIQIGIDTATALSKALSVTQSPSPDNVLTGGLAGVAKYAGIAAMIFANAAKAKQILASGNASGSAPTLGGGGGGGSANIPMQLGAPRVPGQESTLLRQQTPTVKAIVVESDISTVQNRINTIKENATI